MKAAVNKITEGAKLRDTIGRNMCPCINVSKMTATELLDTLFKYQLTVSSDNVEKVTNTILIDSNNKGVLLKYRGLGISGFTDSDIKAVFSKVTFSVSTDVETALLDEIDDVKGDELNDK